MRVMVVSMLTLAAVAAGFLFCPTLRNRMAVVLFGQQAQVETPTAGDELARHATEMLKDGAASALQTVRSRATALRGGAASQPRKEPVRQTPPSSAGEVDPEPSAGAEESSLTS